MRKLEVRFEEDTEFKVLKEIEAHATHVQDISFVQCEEDGVLEYSFDFGKLAGLRKVISLYSYLALTSL